MAYRLPAFNVLVNFWRSSNWAAGWPTPPVVVPDVQVVGNITPGRRGYPGPTFPGMYILLPSATDVRFTEDGTELPFSAVNPDLAEVPAGSARWYTVQWVDYVALGFANEHMFAYISVIAPVNITPPILFGDLLLEDGTEYLLEDATFILLE